MLGFITGESALCARRKRAKTMLGATARAHRAVSTPRLQRHSTHHGLRGHNTARGL